MINDSLIITHKILEKLSDADLTAGGLGLILSFIIYACTVYPKWVPICSQLPLFYFFNTSAFITVAMVKRENRWIWKCSVRLHWCISFLIQRFIFSSLQSEFSAQVLYFLSWCSLFFFQTWHFVSILAMKSKAIPICTLVQLLLPTQSPFSVLLCMEKGEWISNRHWNNMP